MSITAVSSPDRTHSAETAHVLLPAELLLDVFSLCETSSRIPAACRACASDLFESGQLPHRIWAHRQIFFNPEHDPKVVNTGNPPARKHAIVNSWYPNVSQCESHLAYYLKAHLPMGNDPGYGCAAGLAPEPGHHVPATVFSAAMVEWLFEAAGPIGKQRRQNKELDVFDALINVCWPTSSSRKLAKYPSLPTWRLIPDPFLLAAFFIRTSQLDLLQLTLNRLLTQFPALLMSTAPFSLWARLMLDNRTELRSFLRAVFSYDDDPCMSYPTFLCFLALIDWSKTTLDVIARVFADSFNATIAATLITSTRHMMDSILSTLPQLTSPPSDSSRVLSILDWFQANNAHISLEDFPFLSHRITGSYSIFANVFLSRDLANLPFLVGNPARHVLGLTITHWVLHGHSDLLPVALEYDLLTDEHKGRLMRHAAETGDEDGLLATVAAACTGDGETLQTAVLHAFKKCRKNVPHPPFVYSTLLNTLVTYGPLSLDPTAFLTQHSQMWSRRALSVMLFDLPAEGALLFTWDYARYLDQQLSWVADYREIAPDCVEFMGALIDRCIEEPGTQWDELNAEKAAMVCALRLAAAAYKYKFVARGDALGAVTIVEDKDAGVIEFFTLLAAAKITTSDSDNDSKPFSLQLSRGARDLLHAAIKSATSFSPTAACLCDQQLTAHSAACPVSDPRAIHNLIFDTLYMLDRAFVLAHVAWRHPASVRVWHRFEPAEVASRINMHRAVRILRLAMCESPIDQVADQVKGTVNGLPRLLMVSLVVVCGLRGLMRATCVEQERRDAMVSGLDASLWGDEWRERIASVTPLPEEEEEEEDRDDGEEFCLFD